MADIRSVRTEGDYEAALARIDDLMGAEPGTPDGRELDVLVDLVEMYESRLELMEPQRHSAGDRQASSPRPVSTAPTSGSATAGRWRR